MDYGTGPLRTTDIGQEIIDNLRKQNVIVDNIKKLEKLSKDTKQSQLFIETPYRNDKLFSELIKSLNAFTKVCIACDITLPTEFIDTKTVKEWSQEKLELHKRPTIFIIQA